MGLFDKRGILGGIFDDGPSIVDKLDMLFTDVETEGKKQGYSKAATEYEKAFKAIEAEYIKTKELIESQKNMYGGQSEALIEKLEILENQKHNLENQVKQKAKAVSEKYDIPIYQIQSSLAAGTLIAGSVGVDALDVIYRYKEQKLREAEQRGYLEAKEIYETKIDKLKKDLALLKNKGKSEIRELLGMMDDVLEAIAEEQMKIAELKILL